MRGPFRLEILGSSSKQKLNHSIDRMNGSYSANNFSDSNMKSIVHSTCIQTTVLNVLSCLRYTLPKKRKLFTQMVIPRSTPQNNKAITEIVNEKFNVTPPFHYAIARLPFAAAMTPDEPVSRPSPLEAKDDTDQECGLHGIKVSLTRQWVHVCVCVPSLQTLSMQ